MRSKSTHSESEVRSKNKNGARTVSSKQQSSPKRAPRGKDKAKSKREVISQQLNLYYKNTLINSGLYMGAKQNGVVVVEGSEKGPI